MIYLSAIISSLSILVVLAAVIFFILKGKDLGYLKFHLSVVIYGFSLFTPLFYGSMGILNQWPNAADIYSYSLLAFPLGAVGFYIIIALWDYVLKR